MSSIAGRQLRLLLLGGIIACILAAAALIIAVRVTLIRDFERTLVDRTRLLATLVEYSEEHEVEFDEEARDAGAYADEDDPEYFQVWLLTPHPPNPPNTPPASELARSESLDELPDLPLPDPRPNPNQPVHTPLRLPDGRHARATTVTLIVDRADEDLPIQEQQQLLARQERVAITVAASTQPVNALLTQIAITVALTGAALLAVFAIISLWTVRRGLTPLHDANQRVQSIDALQLSARIDESNAPAELAPLIGGINALLNRLESSFDRERLSRTMLAHELRNPIAELLASAEVAARFNDDPQLMKRSLDRILEGTRDLHRFVDTLLHVARVQSGQEEPRRQTVDVTETVESVLSAHEPLTKTKSLQINLDAEHPVSADSDPALLHVVISNLIANAIEHTPPNTAVNIAVTNGDHLPTFRCTNPAIPQDTPPPPATQRGATTHAGLGLAATHTLCQTLGATLTLNHTPSHFTAELQLPPTPTP